MKSKTQNLLIIGLIGIVIYLIWSTKETFNSIRGDLQKKRFKPFKDKSAIVTTTVPFNAPNPHRYNTHDIWNECRTQCNINNPKSQFKDYYKDKDGNIYCRCSYKGKLTKRMVGCPKHDSLQHTNGDCFVWNIEDGKKKCPQMCSKYLPNHKTKWSGHFINTSPHTSACECLVYS